MEGGVVNLGYVELPCLPFGEVFEEYLETVGRTIGHPKFKMIPVHGRTGPGQISVAEHLLEGAYGPGPFCHKPFSHMGEQPEPAPVLTVKVDFAVTASLGGYQFPTVLCEVFLKAATFSISFFTWLFLGTFTEAPKWRFT